jgi:uncharacterized membrane protein
MNSLARITVVMFALLVVSVVPAMAQQFDAEIDCGGVFAPGDQVPLTLRFENQTLQSIAIKGDVTVRVPGLGDFEYRQGNFTLGPNEDRDFNLTLNLPQNAPNGSYTVRLRAMSNQEMTFDTCSFQVQ